MAVVKKLKGKTHETKHRPVEKEEDFELPTEPSEPESSIGAYTWLIFGDKKIGKTSLSAMFGKSIHLFTEPGGKALRLYPVVIDTWKTFKRAVKALKKSDQFNTVVVDIVDKLYPMVEDYTCEKLVISDLADEEWGKGWRENRKEFERVFGQLLNMGKGVIFISHAQEQEIETREGDKYDRMMPTMHKRMRDLVEGSVDVWAYYTYAGRRRVLQILGDDHVSAGHRLEGRFLTPDGRPIRRIDMGASPQEAYRNVVRAFHNKFVPPRDSDVDETRTEVSKKPKIRIRKTS